MDEHGGEIKDKDGCVSTYLVALDLAQAIKLLDLITFLDKPLHDLYLRNTLADICENGGRDGRDGHNLPHNT